MENTFQHSPQYVAAMGRLVGVVQDLSQAHDLPTVMSVVRKAARDLTGADGATFVLRDGNKCFYADENAISPLWKGQRFPMETCISGWVMMNAKPAVIEDIYQDPRIPHDAYRPTFVKSLAMVPIRQNKPIGAIGNYWASNRQPTEEEINLLQALANVTSVTLENVDLYNRLQEKVDALEKSNEELSSFAWAASHDLKSPLRAIDHLSQWIEEDMGSDIAPHNKEHLDMLRQRVKRMEQLLNDVLTYAKADNLLEGDNIEMADGKTLLRDIELLTYLPEGFSLNTTGNFKTIRVPRLPLQRIFSNLTDNAVRHHDRKTGIITINCEERETDYLFSVSDDGPGIDPQYHEKIFEMFQTLQPRDAREGSGMGLALVKKILELHKGSIRVESMPGQGATFHFTWPKSLGTFPR